MRIRETVPGSYVVRYRYRGTLGGRRRMLDGSVCVAAESELYARDAAVSERGHLERFEIVSVEPETRWREATREEEARIGAAALERIRARRAAREA